MFFFYREILTGSSKYFPSPISIPSKITSQFIWFNKNIRIDEKCIYFEQLSINGLNFVGNLFEKSRNIKLWVKIKEGFYLLESKKFNGCN